MADLTATFNTLLKGREAPPTRRPAPGTVGEFLNEAQRIASPPSIQPCRAQLTIPQCTLVTRLHSELRNLRQAYLSTAGPRKTHLRTSSRGANSPPVSLTDRDREEIDANAKMTLRDLNARIRALEDAEQLRRNTEAALIQKRFARGLGGALGAWASGMGGAGVAEKSGEQAAAETAARQFGEHRESIIWFLRQRLQAVVKTQQKMMETRLARELEKSRSIPAKARGPILVSSPGRDTNDLSTRGSGSAGPSGGQRPPAEEDQMRRPPPVEDLTPEQMQMFEKGNQDMLKHFESTLDKVR